MSLADRAVAAAGAGTGKSRAVVARIRHLVHIGVAPKQIIALSFSNSAGHVLAQRLDDIRLRYIGTRHGLMFRLIQSYGNLLGYRQGSVSIVTEATEKMLLQGIKKKFGCKLSDKALYQNAVPESNLIWNEYRHTLKRENMCSYDQILIDGLALLQLDSVREAVAVTDYLCDEAQDNSALDWSIDEAFPAVRKLWVGDDAQAIYKFRGSHPELFIEAAAKYELHLLTLNYRSDSAITTAANNLIAHNPNQVKKQLAPVSKEPGSVTVTEVANDDAEIFESYRIIRESAEQMNDCAILCRTNALADKFRTMLRGFGVGVKQSGVQRMPEDWSVALSAIGLLIDPSNNHHAEQVLRHMGFLPATIEAMKLTALRGSTSLLATVAGVPNMEPTTLGDALTSLCALRIGDESMELIRQRVAVLPNENPTLSDLLADLWNHDRWNVEDEGEGISVTTIHGAKGKEWDLVIVPACEERILPHLTKESGFEDFGKARQSEIEEERRLFFVAITRARHQLVLMHAKQRTAFGKVTNQEPSRFLSEIK